MEKKQLISAGKIVGVHGIRGGLKILSHLEKAENFNNYKNYFIDGKPVELALNFVKGNVAVVHLNGIRKRELAETYIGKEIFIDKSELAEATENEYYYADLIGLKVISEGKEIGSIVSVENFGAGDLFEIEFLDKNRPARLYPFKKDIFPNIDIASGVVEVTFPPEEFVQ